MKRCMLCGKEREDAEVSGGICRPCADGVRRDAAGGRRREKQASDQALRSRGQRGEKSEPKPPKRSR